MNIGVLTRGLSKIFGELSTAQAEEIIQLLGIQHVKGGEQLFHQGSKDKALYIVIQGLFRSIQEKDGISRILGDIGISEPVGEFAFFSNEPRSASVLALRDSSVLKVDDAAYALLSKHFPSFPFELTRFIIARLKENSGQGGTGGQP